MTTVSVLFLRQGLLEPAKPKVKLSNLYRVLGEQVRVCMFVRVYVLFLCI